MEIAPGSVAKQKARLLRKADTTGAPLVWVLDDYVGIGNALDAYVRAVIEARHRRRSLIIKSPILRNLCRIVACEGLVGAKRDDLSRNERLCLASSHKAGESDHCVYYTTFGWRNGKYPPDYDLSLYDGRLTAARRAILREFLPRREHGELLKRFLPILENAFVGASVEEAIAPSQRYAVALHLRTLDFIEGIDLRGHQPVAFLLRETSASLHAIERTPSRDSRIDGVIDSIYTGKNATDAAAFDWLQTRKARFKWTCLVRRLRALGLGCSPNQKVFLAAVASWVEINQ